MGSSANYQRLLSIKSFRSLWAAQIGSQLAINTLLFILALQLYQSTGSNTAVSALFLAYGVPAVLFGMVAGTAVDHLDKRRVLIYCDLLRAALVLLLFFVSGNIFLVYLVTFINAVITQFYVPAEAPLIPKLVPTDLLVPANSLFSFTFYSSLAIGTILAGPLLKLFGPHWIFVLVSAFFGVAVLFEYRIPSMAQGVLGFRTVLSYELSHIFSRVWEELIAGLKYVKTSKVLLDSLLLLTGTQIIFAMLGTLGPGFADRVLNIDVRDASLLIVGPAVVGILVGTLWVGSFGYRIKKHVLISTGIIGAGSALLLVSLLLRLTQLSALASYFTSTSRLVISVVLFFFLGFANSLLDVPANSLLQQEAKGSMRGRVYGMLTASVGGVGILPVVIGGILADALGVGRVVFFLGVLVFAYGAYRLKYNR